MRAHPTRRACAGALAALLAAAACKHTPTLPDWENRYGQLAGKLDEARFKGESTAALEQELSDLAADTSLAAQETADPRDAVTLWRFAALGAWQAGPKGAAQLPEIVAAGSGACERLAPPDLAAPGDCLTIRMTPIRADYDRAKAAVGALQAKPQPLSSADGAAVARLFGELERDFQQASALGQRFSTSRIDPTQLGAVGHDLKRITCLAGASLALSPDAGAALAPRLEAMRSGLDAELRDAPCA